MRSVECRTARHLWRSGSCCGLVASQSAAGQEEGDSVQPREFTDDQRKAMLSSPAAISSSPPREGSTGRSELVKRA